MRTRIVAAILAGAWVAGGPAAAQDAPPQDLFRAKPGTYAPRYDPGRPHPTPSYPLAPYRPLPYSIVIDDTPARPSRQASPSAAGQATSASQGYLSLFVQPVTAQIYVDGFFVGAIDDYAGSPGPLIEAGTHRVELRAAGYETAAFDARIVAGGVFTHRADLVKTGAGRAPAAIRPPSPRPAAARTFYVIPRCYAGDTPPTAAHLPAGCNLEDTRTVTAPELEGSQGAGLAIPPPRNRER